VPNVSIASTVQNPSAWSVTAYVEPIDATHAVLDVQGYSGDDSTLFASPGSAQPFVEISAKVPDGAKTSYGAAELLSLENLQFYNSVGQPITVRTADAVHKNVFLGDADASGSPLLYAYDATLVSRVVALNLDSGFYNEPLTDPVIIAGMNEGNELSKPGSYDVTILSLCAQSLNRRSGVSMPVQMIAMNPDSLSLTIDPIDPTVEIGNPGTVAQAGATVDTSVRVTDNPHGLEVAQFTITYDPNLLVLTDHDVKAGKDLAGKDWTITEEVDQSAGVVYVSMAGAPLTVGTPELLNLEFHVRADASGGTSPLDIAGSLNAGTVNELAMTPVDGSITVVAANASVEAPKAAARMKQPADTGALSPSLVDRLLAEPGSAGQGSASVAQAASAVWQVNDLGEILPYADFESIDSLVSGAGVPGQKKNRVESSVDSALLSMYGDGEE
jgi:hypothetical protein